MVKFARGKSLPVVVEVVVVVLVVVKMVEKVIGMSLMKKEEEMVLMVL